MNVREFLIKTIIIMIISLLNCLVIAGDEDKKTATETKLCKLLLDSDSLSLFDEITVELWDRRYGDLKITNLDLSNMRGKEKVHLQITLERFNGISKEAKIFIKATYKDEQKNDAEISSAVGGFVYPMNLTWLPNVWCASTKISEATDKIVLESIGGKQLSNVEEAKLDYSWILYFKLKKSAK